MDERIDPLPLIQRYVPDAFREFIEQTYYQQISRQATLEQLLQDEAFLKNPIKHIALYSDHGLVHVRDVARQLKHVIDTINGVIIPARTRYRLNFMHGYGMVMAYLHDIGMQDFSDYGRFMHPEFAAQAVFTSDFDPYVELLWEENAGNMAWRLMNLAAKGGLQQSPRLVFRELLALSICHSKSKVPIEFLNHPELLRTRMLLVIGTRLEHLFLKQKLEKFTQQRQQTEAEGKVPSSKLQARLHDAQAALDAYEAKQPPQPPSYLGAHYGVLEQEGFCWLQSEEAEGRQLVRDVMDTLRALRCADALRQRGTTFRTSAGYEVFVNQKNANAIYALRNQDHSRLLLYEGKKALNAGEANLASSELSPEGDLRVSFHRGAFFTTKATKKAASNAAVVINDIQADVIQSFRGVLLDCDPETRARLKPFEDIQILIEGVDDNPEFAYWVCQKLFERDPEVGRRSKPVASLQHADLPEVQRYLQGRDLDDGFDLAAREHLLAQIGEAGHRIDDMSVEECFQEVKVVAVESGEHLIRAGSYSGFVYIPMDEGLNVLPLGGYMPAPARAWVPLGNTGVIRGAIRNAHVMVERSLSLLMIPRQIYLQHWHQTYNNKQLGDALSRLR